MFFISLYPDLSSLLSSHMWLSALGSSASKCPTCEAAAGLMAVNTVKPLQSLKLIIFRLGGRGAGPTGFDLTCFPIYTCTLVPPEVMLNLLEGAVSRLWDEQYAGEEAQGRHGRVDPEDSVVIADLPDEVGVAQVRQEDEGVAEARGEAGTEGPDGGWEEFSHENPGDWTQPHREGEGESQETDQGQPGAHTGDHDGGRLVVLQEEQSAQHPHEEGTEASGEYQQRTSSNNVEYNCAQSCAL